MNAPMDAPINALSRHRTTVLLVLAVLVLLAGVVWLQRDQATYGGPLDPRNPKPAGAEAVARVLDRQGVTVDVVRGQDALLATDVGSDVAVVVTDADALGRSTLARLRDHASAARTVVLVGSSSTLLRAYGLAPADPVAGTIAAGCRTPVLAGLAVRLREADAVQATGCFRRDGRVVVARPAPHVWLVTASELFRNDRVLRADNAAVALRLLGQQPRLVWYVDDPADTVASDAVSVGTFLPRWLVPALWTGAIAAVAFLLWRARRLGPLVREPVPVVVRAAETTESRGRLYRRARDRDHAARMLRAATRRRVAARLSLPDDDPVTVSQALPNDRDLVVDRPVAGDAALAELGRDLLELEDRLP